HRSTTFRELTEQAVVWLSTRGVRNGSALAVAHVGVELLLDASLSGDEPAQRAYLAALAGAALDALRTALTLDSSLPGDEPAQRAYLAALAGAALDDLGRHLTWDSDDERVRFDHLRVRLVGRR